jgi:hypothetical protein
MSHSVLPKRQWECSARLDDSLDCSVFDRQLAGG